MMRTIRWSLFVVVGIQIAAAVLLCIGMARGLDMRAGAGWILAGALMCVGTATATYVHARRAG